MTVPHLQYGDLHRDASDFYGFDYFGQDTFTRSYLMETKYLFVTWEECLENYGDGLMLTNKLNILYL